MLFNLMFSNVFTELALLSTPWHIALVALLSLLVGSFLNVVEGPGQSPGRVPCFSGSQPCGATLRLALDYIPVELSAGSNTP